MNEFFRRDVGKIELMEENWFLLYTIYKNKSKFKILNKNPPQNFKKCQRITACSSDRKCLLNIPGEEGYVN